MDTPSDTLARLEATIKQRLGASPDESYVAKLHARGLPVIARKLGEDKPPETQKQPQFLPYGTPCDESPDPVACALALLREEIAVLRARLDEAERLREAPRKPISIPLEEPRALADEEQR